MNDKDDSYDELLVLARDARSTRKRTNYWTTGLIISGMVASTAYVATVNQQMSALKDASESAAAENLRLNIDVSRLQSERVALAAERDVYRQNAAWFATMAPALAERPDGTVVVNPPIQPTSTTPADFALSNLVWYVDGSRRFPMAANDILWIPEGQFWVQLEDPQQNVAPSRMTVHFGERPGSGTQNASGDAVIEGPFDLSTGAIYQRSVDRGVMNCVQIKLESQTQRPAFGNGYADMIVTYLNSSSCTNGLITP